MSGRRIELNRPISPILTLKLVAIATSLERSEKKEDGQICDQIITYGENLVKIVQVDPEIIFLKRFYF